MAPAQPETPRPIIEGQGPPPPRRSVLTRRPPRAAWKRWLLGFGLTLLLLFAVALGLRLWWGWRAHRAMEQLVAELHGRGQPVTLEDFQPQPIPDNQNAALLLSETPSLLEGDPAASAAERLVREYYFHPQLVRRDRAKVSELLYTLGPVFERVAQARGRRRCQWSVRLTHPVINVPMLYLSSQRDLSRLIAIRAVERAVAGDHGAAIRAVQDCLRLADWVRDEPPGILAHMVGMALTGAGLNALETILPTLAVGPPARADEGIRPVGREQLRQLTRRLLDDALSADQWRRSIWAERLFICDSIDGVRRGTLGPVPGVKPPTWSSRMAGWALGPMLEFDAVFAMRHLTALADVASRPTWPQAVATAPKYPASKNPFQRSAHLLSSILMGSGAYERTLELHYREIAMRRMAAVAIALRLYELDHGSRPETLDALVPDYLRAIPIDPFSDPPAPLRCALDNDPPVIYSVNSDGQDDGGKFALRSDGSVEADAMDLVWFLDGDRPTGEPTEPLPARDPDARTSTRPARPPTGTASGPAVEDQAYQEDDPR